MEPPTSIQQEEEAARFSIHKEDSKQAERTMPSEHAGGGTEVDAMEEGPAHEGSVTETGTLQKAGKRSEGRWNNKKKRGSNRQTVTLGGLHRIEKSKKRKEKQKQKQKLRRKLGGIEIQVHEGWKHKKQSGPLPPTRSVIFLDNTWHNSATFVLLKTQTCMSL